MERITKPTLVRLIKGMQDDQTRRDLIAILLKDGTLTEDDLAAFAQQEIEEHLDRFLDAIKGDRLLQFYWERFKDYPQYLARALARLRPDLFYTYGLAFRFILKLRTDLGTVVVPPHRPGGEPLGIEPMPELAREIRQDLFALDLECRFRELLYFFSVDLAAGRALLDDEIARAATDYDREVLTAVRERVTELLGMEFPGVVPTLNGRPFPALHVRWWLAQSRDVPRCLNIGGTGTYKTSFAVLAMHRDPRTRVLVLCAPHARDNWAREIASYFRRPPAVRVIRSAEDLRSRSDAPFTVVGYSTLIRPDAVEALLACSFDGLIMDECQYGKGIIGPEAARAMRAVASQRLVHELPLQRFIALSATPWENRPDEFAAIASALRPDLFPTPERFLRSGAGQSPRFLRELFAEQVLEVELREISDLPPITPRPWEDPCGVEPIAMGAEHAALYRFVADLEPGDDEEPNSIQKVQLLLQAAIHPHLLERDIDWPDELRAAFRDWQLSTKLQWLREFVAARIGDAKIVIGTGLFVDGVTRLEDGDAETAFVDRLLREWFGQDRVCTIDGSVSARANGRGLSPRDALIAAWRTDPGIRILHVSMRACPDSLNLTIPKADGVTKLWITALSFGWKPWEQFLGRFWREGQGVPVEYRVPILTGTIDEDLLRLNMGKWRAQRLFHAQVPLSESEWGLLRKSGIQQLGTLLRSSVKEVFRITSMMRGRGEEKCTTAYAAKDGGIKTNAELFAEHFVRIQEHAGSGHISRFLSRSIDEFVAGGLMRDERCLDAGCGPLTMARRRNAPWHSVDMNPHMIAAGRTLAPHLAVNARVGFLSELPEAWTGQFDLVVCSLVLHFSSLMPVRHAEPERLRILRELVRVTNPHGLLWLMWNEGYQTDETFLAWVEGFTREGFTVHWPSSGLVRATEAPKAQPYRCWSLLVSPDGHVPRFPSVDAFRFPFELARRKTVRGGRDPDRDGLPPSDVRERKAYQHFEVRDVRTQAVTVDTTAARAVAIAEVERIVAATTAGKAVDRKLYGVPAALASNWRVLEALRQRGILHLETEE